MLRRSIVSAFRYSFRLSKLQFLAILFIANFYYSVKSSPSRRLDPESVCGEPVESIEWVKPLSPRSLTG